MINKLMRITIHTGGKIGIFILSILILYIFTDTGTLFPEKKNEVKITLTEEKLNNTDDEKTLRVAFISEDIFAPAVIAGDGLFSSNSSIFSSDSKIKVKIIIFDRIEDLYASFLKHQVDIIGTSVNSFAEKYPGISSINPVAFFQYAWSRGSHIIAVKKSTGRNTGPGPLKTACVKNSSGQFTMLYLQSIGNKLAAGVKWKYALTPKIAFMNTVDGKADIYAGPEYIAGKSISEDKSWQIYTTKQLSNLIAFVFITRESEIITNPDRIKHFITGWLKGSQKMLQEPESSVALIAETLGMPKKDAEKQLLQFILTDYYDNLSFFSISKNKTVDFYTLYDLAVKLWNNNSTKKAAFCASLSANTGILYSLKDCANKSLPLKNKYVQIVSNRIDLKSLRPLSDKITLSYNYNSTDLEPLSIPLLKGIAEMAEIVKPAYLKISGFEEETENQWLNLPTQRVEKTLLSLSKKYSLSPQRFIFIRNETQDKTVKNNRRVTIELAIAP